MQLLLSVNPIRPGGLLNPGGGHKVPPLEIFGTTNATIMKLHILIGPGISFNLVKKNFSKWQYFY